MHEKAETTTLSEDHVKIQTTSQLQELSQKKIFIKLVMQVGCKTDLHGLLTEDESGLDPKEAEKQT
jgi:hypothetical protein